MTDVSRNARLKAVSLGARAETIAALWLQAKGYRILARQYAVRSGELDLVAARGTTVAFVEVKARPSVAEALGAISETKRRRIRRAAEVWIARNPGAAEGRTLRGDAILVGGWRPPLHIENAFPLEFA